jgi:amidase
VHPQDSSLDCVGVFARDVAVVTRAMQALAPVSPHRARRAGPACPPVSPVDPSVADAFDRAVSSLSLIIEDGVLPDLEAAFDASLIVMGAENWSALGVHADHPGMGEDVRARLKTGASTASMPSMRHRPSAPACAGYRRPAGRPMR